MATAFDRNPYAWNIWQQLQINPAWQEYLRTGMIPPHTTTGESTNWSDLTGFRSGVQTGQSIYNPFITPDYAPLATQQRDILFNRLGGSDGFGSPTADNPLAGYKAEGLRNIGMANTAASKSLEDALISRGLGGKTAAGQDVLAGNALSTQSSFLNSLPMMSRQLQDQDLQAAGEAVKAFGTGQQGQTYQTENSRYGQNTRGGGTTSNTDWGGPDIQGLGSLITGLLPYGTKQQSGFSSFLSQLFSNPATWATIFKALGWGM